jgi:hypothetical protein
VCDATKARRAAGAKERPPRNRSARDAAR